jgi:beta-lactamase regulating signal transducer with metallopeptidase domain
MNSLIESLNQWGGQFLNFAWPMFWQSSLLIVLVFALDWLLARKIRASVRHALWLVVVVKLLLPPTLALPTGAAWWLFQTKPVVKAPVVRNYTVTYDTAPQADFIPQTIPLPAPVPSKLDAAGWALLGLGAVSVGLLSWLVVRWWQVARMVRRATASARFADALEAARRLAGLRSRPRLKLVEGRMSPAVCGLFRPVILLPRALVEQLSPAQLRAVLLHELFHLRRLDVWVNCAQALLQIVYWWHPLLWMANARIRRVREEAVDDAVMLALRDEADSYAPTLLEVAKLAFRRPLLSLGLVGIMESRSALRQRVERLVDFRPPRKAGLTFASLCGIFVFSAVALPMGEGPIKSSEPSVVLQTNKSNPWPDPQFQGYKNINMQAQFFIIDESSLRAVVPFSTKPLIVASNEVANLEIKLKQAGARCFDSTIPFPWNWDALGKASGWRLQYHIGGYTNGSTEAFTKDAGGNFRNVAVGMGTKLPATDSNWTPLDFTLVPWITGDSIRCEIELQFRSNTNHSQRADILVPAGGAMLWIAAGENAGKRQFILLRSQIPDKSVREAAKAIETEQLVQDAKLLYEQDKLDDAETKLKVALALEPENAAAKYYLGLVQTNRPATGLYLASEGRREILKKLNTIRLDNIRFDAVPLGEVLRTLNAESRKQDADQRGINFLVNPNPDQNVAGVIDPITGFPVVTNAVPSVDLGVLPITFHRTLTNASVADVLDAVVMVSPKPIKYSIQDFGVVFSAMKPSTPLYSRHFRVDPNIFTAAAQNELDIKSNSVSTMARDFFRNLGVNLDPATPGGLGKGVFFNDRLGELYVRATAQDLDTIENALVVLNQARPQIHIKARFLKVPRGTLDGLKNVISVTNTPTVSNRVAGLVGILTDTDFRTALRNLKALPGVEILAEPEVVTTSGRQAQMRATQTTVTIITNFVFEEFPTNHDGSVGTSSITVKTGPIETGPIFDVMPYVLSDGYTLDLQMTASSMEFYGYADIPTNLPPLTVTTSTGETVNPPQAWPAVLRYQKSAHLNLFDNQTVILSLNNPEAVRFGEPDEKREVAVAKHIRDTAWHNGGRNDILVFVTATIVDPAGNRVHSDDELSFAKDKIPPQPPQLK